MATLDRNVKHHDCRVELRNLEVRNPGLGTGSRATCSCGQRWYIGAPIQQYLAAGITGTRWVKVQPEA
jgi:hypothetical protein